MRQGDFPHLGAHGFKIVNRLADGSLNLCVHAGDEIFLRQSDLQSLDILRQGFRIVGNGAFACRRIHRVVSRDDVQEICGIRDVSRQGTDLIEGGGVCDESVAGDAPVGRFESDDTAERGGRRSPKNPQQIDWRRLPFILAQRSRISCSQRRMFRLHVAISF